MIALFNDAGDRLAINFRTKRDGTTLNLNQETDPATGTYEVNNITMSMATDSITEAKQNRDGIEQYAVTRNAMTVSLSGVARASSYKRLFDMLHDLAFAMDAASMTASDAAAVADLTFSTPTADSTNYAAGYVPSKYIVRPRQMPTPTVSQFNGTSFPFTCEFTVLDPRRYWTGTVTPKTATGTIDNSLATYRSWPTLTLTMSGAGSATYTISVGGVPLVLNLSGRSNGQTVVVDFEKKKITVNGTENASLYVSGTFFEIGTGAAQALSITNTTNTASSLSWKRAFAL
jgi:hypothetical protein